MKNPYDDVTLCLKNGESATLLGRDIVRLYALSLLQLIPLAGPFVYLTVCILWASDEDTCGSARNYLKVALAEYLFSIALTISVALFIIGR